MVAPADEEYDVFGENARVGHHGSKHEHDAQQHPHGQSCYPLEHNTVISQLPSPYRTLIFEFTDASSDFKIGIVGCIS